VLPGPPPDFEDSEHEGHGRGRGSEREDSRSRSPTPEFNNEVTELPDLSKLTPEELKARREERARQEMEQSMKQFHQGKLDD
jgi:hypothetical protein